MNDDIQVNLMRDLRLPPQRRRLLYRGLKLYMIVWGTLLVLTAFYTARNLNGMLDSRAEAQRLELKIEPYGADAASVASESRKIHARLTGLRTRLGQVNRLAGHRFDLPQVTRQLMVPLHAHSHMLNMEVNSPKKRFEFEVATPVSARVTSQEVASLLDAWKNDPFLNQHFDRFEQVDSRRYSMEETTVNVHSFIGRLKQKGGG